jgi:hypothetical protein
MQSPAETEEEAFKTPADLLREIAQAECNPNTVDAASFATMEAPEMQPALLVGVSQTSSLPTVAHLGASCPAAYELASAEV